MKRLLLLTVLLLSILGNTVSAQKQPVILDADMVDWLDDGAAMLMLAKSPPN